MWHVSRLWDVCACVCMDTHMCTWARDQWQVWYQAWTTRLRCPNQKGGWWPPQPLEQSGALPAAEAQCGGRCPPVLAVHTLLVRGRLSRPGRGGVCGLTTWYVGGRLGPARGGGWVASANCRRRVHGPCVCAARRGEDWTSSRRPEHSPASAEGPRCGLKATGGLRDAV